MRLNNGVFTRTYRFGKQVYAIAFHTPTRTVNIFENESAEVWELIHNSCGDLAKAKEYIIRNGNFSRDKCEEAQEVLNAFLETIEEANLISGKRNRPAPPQIPASLIETVSADYNPEQQIAQVMADHNVMYSLTLETTYRCNERCIHCYIPQHNKANELSIADIDSLFSEFKAIGGFQLLITGGEIGLRSDLSSILDLAKRHSFVTSLNSNLTMISDSLLEDIAAIYPKSVSCSIYSTDPDIHDSVTQVKGSYERTIRSVRKLVSMGVQVAIKSPLMKQTATKWCEIELLANDLGCAYQIDLSITAKNDGGLSPADHRVVDEKILKDIYSSSRFNATIMGEPIFNGNMVDQNANICGAGASGLTVSPDGSVRPCIGIAEPIGKYPETPLADIWHDQTFKEFWKTIKLCDIPCGKCDYFATCSRCPGAWKLESGSYSVPTSYNCLLGRAWYSASRADK